MGKRGRVLGEWWAWRDTCGERVVPACAGMTEKGAARVIGAQRDWCGWLAAVHPPPNLPPKRGEG